jgi:hypothetical protein
VPLALSRYARLEEPWHCGPPFSRAWRGPQSKAIHLLVEDAAVHPAKKYEICVASTSMPAVRSRVLTVSAAHPIQRHEGLT